MAIRFQFSKFKILILLFSLPYYFHVLTIFNSTAARLRVAANEKAEAEKILQIKRAEGEAESKYLAGLGIARQRQAIVDGLRDSVLGFSVNVPGTSAKDVMDMVLVTQYFDTMKEIGASSKSSAVFIPHGPGAVRDVAQQIRDGLLQASVQLKYLLLMNVNGFHIKQAFVMFSLFFLKYGNMW